MAAAREISGWATWQRWEIDLERFARRPVHLELSTTLPAGVRLLLRDAYVEHHAAAAAGWPRPGVHVEHDEARAVAGDPSGGGSAGSASPPAGPALPTPSPPGPSPPTSSPPATPSSPAARRRGSAPQILLVSVDTLRADVLEATTADGAPLAPNLRRLAAEGERFTPHHAGASWTKPSHAMLLTGYPLSVHGADGVEATIDPAVPTLAERLRRAGLATGGMVHDCVWLNPKFGFARGFDDYRSVKWGGGQIGRVVVQLDGSPPRRPFFFFLHTFDVHSDFYHLPYEGAGATAAGVEALFGVPHYGCRQGECASGLLAAINEHRVAPLPQEPEILRHLYAAGVAEVDGELGRLFDDLRGAGLWEDLLVVVTADHGEMLLEHGATSHGTSWEPVLRVPLIVKWPAGMDDGRVGVRTTVPTASIDVAATLLAVAGAEAADLPGVDLRRPRAERPIFSGSSSWWAVYGGDWKAILPAGGQPPRLYDLAADAGEKASLASERPEELERLRGDLAALEAWSATARRRLDAGAGAAQGELTREERERLRALGYLR